MKKFLTWLAVGVMACGISFGAFANGPLLGVSVLPVVAAPSFLTFGWDFGDFNIEVFKGNLTDPFGLWNSGLVWTPKASDGFGYRVGATLITNYIGILQYNGFSFKVGMSKTWGPIQIYGDMNLAPTGILGILPVVGVNFLFGDLIPNKVVE